MELGNIPHLLPVIYYRRWYFRNANIPWYINNPYSVKENLMGLLVIALIVLNLFEVIHIPWALLAVLIAGAFMWAHRY